MKARFIFLTLCLFITVFAPAGCITENKLNQNDATNITLRPRHTGTMFGAKTVEDLRWDFEAKIKTEQIEILPTGYYKPLFGNYSFWYHVDHTLIVVWECEPNNAFELFHALLESPIKVTPRSVSCDETTFENTLLIDGKASSTYTESTNILMTANSEYSGIICTYENSGYIKNRVGMYSRNGKVWIELNIPTSLRGEEKPVHLRKLSQRYGWPIYCSTILNWSIQINQINDDILRAEAEQKLKEEEARQLQIKQQKEERAKLEIERHERIRNAQREHEKKLFAQRQAEAERIRRVNSWGKKFNLNFYFKGETVYELLNSIINYGEWISEYQNEVFELKDEKNITWEIMQVEGKTLLVRATAPYYASEQTQKIADNSICFIQRNNQTPVIAGQKIKGYIALIGTDTYTTVTGASRTVPLFYLLEE